MSQTFCDKEGYSSYKEGMQHIVALTKRKKNHKYNLYKCQHCGHFHITTATKYLREQTKKNKKMEKYPLQVPPIAKHKKRWHKQPHGNPYNVKPEKAFRLATAPMISRLQADILKHKIYLAR